VERTLLDARAVVVIDVLPGANPTSVSYNASAVEIYNAN
jgi:hypothetical protein